MKAKSATMHRALFIKPSSKRLRLRDFSPGDTGGYKDKKAADSKLRADTKALARLQDVLYASAAYGILVIFQGMDSAGKDSAVKHVMSGTNPAGVNVYSFRQPTEEELRHDYLWRAARVAPERGRIAIFNRSYYEDVLITRVHPELLRARGVIKSDDAFWRRRYREINGFERYLVDNRVQVVKFYLNLSKREQARRLLARLEKPNKYWKFSEADLAQRRFWSTYMRVYEETLRETSTAWAPWYVIPADHKWYSHVAIADVLVRRLGALKLRYPRPPAGMRDAVREAKRLLQ